MHARTHAHTHRIFEIKKRGTSLRQIQFVRRFGIDEPCREDNIRANTQIQTHAHTPTLTHTHGSPQKPLLSRFGIDEPYLVGNTHTHTHTHTHTNTHTHMEYLKNHW